MPDAPIFQIHCALRHSDPQVWRCLLVPADLRLNGLHAVLQVAMDWDNEHLWQIQAGHAVYREPDPTARRSIFARKKPLDVRRTSLQQIMKDVGDVVLYEYDFGDNWEIDLRLEAVLERQPGVTYPTCTGGAYAAPPEDCGGPPGFQWLRHSLADPDCDEAMDCVPEGWSAETWDIAQINKRLIGLDEVNEDPDEPADDPAEDPAEAALLSTVMELRIRHDHYDLLRALLAERPSPLPGPTTALDGAEQHRKGRVVRAERRSWNYFLDGLDIGADSADFQRARLCRELHALISKTR